MKIKLFLSASLSALGLWLAAAFLHNVDVASYQPSASDIQTAQSTEKALLAEDSEETVIETAALAQ